MQPGSGGDGGGGGGGGGNEVGKRGGLQRYRSAPATWLEALLEPETDVVFDTSPILLTSNKPPPHPQSQGLQIPPTTPPPPTTPSSSAQLKSGVGGVGGGRFAGDLGLFETAGGGSFLRQNSSPAEFLSQICSDGYLSGFGVSSGYDYLSTPLDVSQSAKRPRDGESENSAAKFSSLLKGEQSGQLRSAGGSLDAEMEQLMEDLVPCKVRAKRGFATHPRSIAERVRRTRISDRIRKLQDLVPNMDKQTNTADMLEEAVEYVKLLQKQIQELREHQKNCTCATTEE